MEANPRTPEEAMVTARFLARQFYRVDPECKTGVLRELKKANPILHDCVVTEIQRLERRREVMCVLGLLGLMALTLLGLFASRWFRP